MPRSIRARLGRDSNWNVCRKSFLWSSFSRVLHCCMAVEEQRPGRRCVELQRRTGSAPPSSSSRGPRQRLPFHSSPPTKCWCASYLSATRRSGKRHGPPIAIFLSPFTSPELDGEVCHRSITNRVHLVNEQCSCRQTDDSPTPHSELACNRWNL